MDEETRTTLVINGASPFAIRSNGQKRRSLTAMPGADFTRQEKGEIEKNRTIATASSRSIYVAFAAPDLSRGKADRGTEPSRWTGDSI